MCSAHDTTNTAQSKFQVQENGVSGLLKVVAVHNNTGFEEF